MVWVMVRVLGSKKPSSSRRSLPVRRVQPYRPGECRVDVGTGGPPRGLGLLRSSGEVSWFPAPGRKGEQWSGETVRVVRGPSHCLVQTNSFGIRRGRTTWLHGGFCKRVNDSPREDGRCSLRKVRGRARSAGTARQLDARGPVGLRTRSGAAGWRRRSPTPRPGDQARQLPARLSSSHPGTIEPPPATSLNRAWKRRGAS